jgi:hypothetical protein
MNRCARNIVALVLAFAPCAVPQIEKHPVGRPGKAAPQKVAFVCSNYVWTWLQNGWTTFTFTLSNQSGKDVERVSYRVLFFDRSGKQIDFAEGFSGPIPNGLGHREAVDLDQGTGMSTRMLSKSQKVEILGFQQAASPK